MKSKTFLFIALLFSFQLIAQNSGINYKAIVNDGFGNILVNAPVTVEFNILSGSGQTLRYNERHTTGTDANGLIVLTIGQGVTSDVFDDIDWSRFIHFLNVKIDAGAGLVDLGTTEFQAVPYALQAENSNTSTTATTATTANVLKLKSGTTTQFNITYAATGDKLQISEISVTGNVLEISSGELTLPQYAGIGEEAIYADANGKLIRKADIKINQTFNRYNFFDPDSLTNGVGDSVKYRLGVQLKDGVTIAGLNAFVLDNEPGASTGIFDTPYLSLERESKTDRTAISEEIFRVEGFNTATDVYTSITTTSDLGTGRDIIDNANYIYYLEIFMCTECDFREITILE